MLESGDETICGLGTLESGDETICGLGMLESGGETRLFSGQHSCTVNKCSCFMRTLSTHKFWLQ